MNYGTIFECNGKRAIRHRVAQSERTTVCGMDLYNKIPDEWGNLIKDQWSNEHELPKEIRCKKCYPNQRKGRKSWPTRKEVNEDSKIGFRLRRSTEAHVYRSLRCTQCGNDEFAINLTDNGQWDIECRCCDETAEILSTLINTLR